MILPVGSRLGHYDVAALISEGGMEEVSRARDPRDIDGTYQKAVDLDSVAHRVRLQPRIDPRVLIRQPSGVRTNVSK